MKYIITDNIRVANAINQPTRMKTVDYWVGKRIRVKLKAGEVYDCIVGAYTWAGQGVVVLRVDQLGDYNSFQKSVLEAAAKNMPRMIGDVKVYWSGVSG